MLWIMKPTIRNVPSVSSPRLNDVPTARPSPRLCRPMPTATSVARARPETMPLRRDVRAAKNVIVRKLSATPSSTRPGPPSIPGSVACSSNASDSASIAEERQQPGRQRHERGEPLRVGAPQRREPEQAERDRQHPDEEADDRVADEAARRRRRRLDRGRDRRHRLDPGRARHADRDRVVLDPVVRHDDRARAQPAELGRPVERVRHDRVVDRDRGDRQVLALRVRDADADLARLELDAADVELVRGRRVLADQVEHRRAVRGEQADHDRQQQDRRERPEPPAQRASAGRCGARFHQSVTSKKPIHPSSVNSDWCAWNMNLPVCAKSISITPRCPWHCMTRSVYSQCSPVPVGW